MLSLGHPCGCLGPMDSRRQGQWLRLAEFNSACNEIGVTMSLSCGGYCVYGLFLSFCWLVGLFWSVWVFLGLGGFLV